MGKIKTKQTLKRRIKITGSGKLMKKQTNNGHLKVKRSADQRHRKNGLEEQTNKGHIKMFRKLLGK